MVNPPLNQKRIQSGAHRVGAGGVGVMAESALIEGLKSNCSARVNRSRMENSHLYRWKVRYKGQLMLSGVPSLTEPAERQTDSR